MAREIAVASGKGGVGKSTVSSTLLLVLHRAGWKVVGVDADADAPNLHLIFGMEKWELERDFEEGFIASIVRERCTECGVCAEVCPFDAVEVVGGMHVINPMVCEGCATCILACPEKAILRRRTVRGRLRWGRTKYGFPLAGARLNPGRPNSGRLVEEVKVMSRRLGGDDAVYIVDSAAGIGCQVISSLAGANAAVLVAEPTPSSFSDLKRVHTVAMGFGLPSALIVNKWDLNPAMAEEIEEYGKRENMHILGRIPYDPAVPKSMSIMVPLIEAFPDSPASKALKEISEEFLEEIMGNWDEWRFKHAPRRIPQYRPIIIKPEGLGGP